MSKRTNEVEISNTNSKKLKKERSVDEAKTEIFYKIIKQIKDILEDPIEKDSTDSLEDTIKDIFQPILDEFKDLIKENVGKKCFIGGVIKIFSMLLGSRATTLTKIIKVVRISTQIALDLWPKQRQQ